MGRAVLRVALVGLVLASTGVACAAPVYELNVTYVTPVVHVFGEDVRVDAVAVPVPTSVGNTPRAFLEDADMNGVPVVGRAARALPQDRYLVDTEDEWASAIALVDTTKDQLPRGELHVAGYDTRPGSASGHLRVYVTLLAQNGLYTEPVYALAATPPAPNAPVTGDLGPAFADHGALDVPVRDGAPTHDPLATTHEADATPRTAFTENAADSGVATSTAARTTPFGLAGLTTAQAVAAAAVAVALPTLLGWALYHRIRGHSHLNQATRKAIYDAVCARPGTGVADVASAADVSYSTASYHLERLKSAGLVVVTGSGTRLRYYKNGGLLNEHERQLHEIFENDGAMRVLEAIRANPGTYRAALADALGVTPTTINWHLKRLRDAGLVKERRLGRSAALFVDADAARDVAAPVLEKVTDSAGVRRARALLVDGDAPRAPPAAAVVA